MMGIRTAVDGAGFMAQGITFENTAGPDGHQAVALRVDSDHSVFQSCSIVGFQDSLYTHALRQLFYNCSIEGTVDFIFGNAAAFFQNCNIIVRVGRPTAITSTLTAQVLNKTNCTCHLYTYNVHRWWTPLVWTCKALGEISLCIWKATYINEHHLSKELSYKA